MDPAYSCSVVDCDLCAYQPGALNASNCWGCSPGYDIFNSSNSSCLVQWVVQSILETEDQVSTKQMSNENLMVKLSGEDDTKTSYESRNSDYDSGFGTMLLHSGWYIILAAWVVVLLGGSYCVWKIKKEREEESASQMVESSFN